MVLSEGNELDGHVTRRELKLNLKVFSAEISKSVGEMFDEKFEAMEDRWNEASAKNYQERVLELTGETIENTDRIRSGIQKSIKDAASEEQTNSEIKKAAIGTTTAIGLGGAITWMLSFLPSSPGN